MTEYYKAVRLDRTSHFDYVTLWRVGKIVRPDHPDDSHTEPCGRGIHVSPTLLDAVGYQDGPSRYYTVEIGPVLGQDRTKIRCAWVKVIRELKRVEIDEIAGFKLWEANHPVNPLLVHRRMSDEKALEFLQQWNSVGPIVWASVGPIVWDSVWASVRDSVRASVRAYTGGLFPNITKWEYTDDPDPWRPLLKLWYGGLLPSFDGETWRLHSGPNADVVLTWTPNK